MLREAGGGPDCHLLACTIGKKHSERNQARKETGSGETDEKGQNFAHILFLRFNQTELMPCSLEHDDFSFFRSKAARYFHASPTEPGFGFL
jgi:hypothetical protein